MSSSTLESQHANAELPPGTTLLISDRGSGKQDTNLFPIPTPDPNEPLNWGKIRKFINFGLVLTVTLVVFTGLSIQILFWQYLFIDLSATFTQLNNAQSINATGLTVGCVFFIPLAIKYGRRPVYIVSTAVMFAMALWTARMTTVWEMYVTNLFMGLAGAVNESIVGMTIADLFFVHQRGTMNGFYLVMVMSGSFLTPMAAGVQATNQGWRNCYWVLAGFLGVVLLAFIFFYEETKYIPLFEGHTVSQVTTSTSTNPNSKDEPVKTAITEDNRPTAHGDASQRLDSSIPLKTFWQRRPLITPTSESLWTLTYRPFIILFNFPDVAFAAIQYGAGLVWLVNIAVIISIIYPYPPYMFTAADVGYMGVGPFIGNLLGSIYCGYLSDRLVLWFSKRNGGLYEPEMRLYLLHLPSLTLTGGIIMFGVTTAQGMHWIYPSIGGALFGFGLGAFGDTVLTYVIDSHKMITGEAFVGIAFVRNVFTIVIAQVREPWLNNMGLQNMSILSGFVALAISLLYIPMIYFGKRARISTAKKYYKLSEHRI